MEEPQNYKNHVRWYPLVHFVISPLLFLNLIWQIVRLYQDASWDRAESVMMAFVFIFLSFAARLQALTAQNRIIRLEETLRYKNILTPELFQKSAKLQIWQTIALRFASDPELPELLQRALNGEFKSSKEIKSAVKNWRGDYLRV